VGAAEALGGACEDGFCRTVWVCVHIVVPHAKHAPSLLCQPLIADDVALRFRMLAAVNLNHELCLSTREIHDVGSDRELPGELGAVAREQLPNLALLTSGVVAQRPGAFGDCDFHASGHCSAVAERASRTHPPGPSLPGRGHRPH